MGRVKTKRIARKQRNPFEPTAAETRRWANVPNVQQKCKDKWLDVLITDAALERQCRFSDEEYHFDPIAMTIACLNNPTKFSKVENPVWKAAYRAAQAQIAFTRCIEHYGRRYRLNLLSIRRTCDPLVLPNESKTNP
jgi:hypothetical protein